MAGSKPPSEPHFHFETIGVHTGLSRSENVVRDAPIYASTSFSFNNSAHGAAIFNGTAEAFCYSRIGNPTIDVFEKRMAALENGEAGLATSSGPAALFLAITALAQAGSNIVVVSTVSESSAHQFRYRLPALGISARFVESGQVVQAIDEHTKGVFVESISCTDLLVADIKSLAGAAHKAGVPLVVDNTVGVGGFLIRPIDHGADIVIASAAEWLSISGSNMAGIIIDSGKFDWLKNKDRFPQFFEPSPGFHGLKLWEKFGNLSFIAFSRAAVMRDTGPCLNPFEAFQLLAGLETLSVRIERNSSNALELALWLEHHAKIGEVRYPGLPSTPLYQVSANYPKVNYGGILYFRVKATAETPAMILDNFKLVSRGSIGGSKTAIVEGEGPGDGRIYVSVGLENIEDIKADFERALSLV
ncbi:O-acetylhomoserine/O-acetylserine sulfhydrylase [Hyaloscypha hepaticicola]|uniref:O-acetylhomoserine/O-acetylserine sulfhydrylase n=1 Tax=Hyaloscypha hepaticicola TaxID=2082293 RepID=A0A2J6QJX8_9HELO|nr:O-acetylhomoserine/O-acetylserine sulfhydrylase [Hyaloscypha hepaticicola]